MDISPGLSDGPGHTVQMHSSPRSPLSGIPVRTAPAAAVSPIQVHTKICCKKTKDFIFAVKLSQPPI